MGATGDQRAEFVHHRFTPTPEREPAEFCIVCGTRKQKRGPETFTFVNILGLTQTPRQIYLNL